MTEDFYTAIAKEESKIKDIAQRAVEYAKSLGVDEAEATIGLQKGLSVSTRKADVENIEFNKNRGLDITVFKDKKRGNASTTDFSIDAIKSCVEAAVNLASFTDADPCAGIADKEDLCTKEKDLKLVYPLTEDVDKVLALALETEKIVLKDKIKGIKDSDGAGCETSLVIKAIANSNGFVGTKARTFNYLGLTLLGDDGIKMQRGSGYSTSLDFAQLKDPEVVAKEAVESGLYDTLQFPFSYLASDKEEELVRLCKEKDVGFICMKALSGGLITRSDVAYAYLAQFDNTLPIWGIQKEKELDEFISYNDNPPVLNDEIKAIIEHDRQELAGEFCRGCGYCMPCPMGIEINQCARMSLMLRRSPSANWLSPHWQEEMKKIETCINCGKCKAHCPYDLNTPELLKKNYEDYKTFLK